MPPPPPKTTISSFAVLICQQHFPFNKIKTEIAIFYRITKRLHNTFIILTKCLALKSDSSVGIIYAHCRDPDKISTDWLALWLECLTPGQEGKSKTLGQILYTGDPD